MSKSFRENFYTPNQTWPLLQWTRCRVFGLHYSAKNEHGQEGGGGDGLMELGTLSIKQRLDVIQIILAVKFF